jgi:16S rRNA (adenine1518-N6/adenine1519-N6)-dimethyltransferase
MSINPISIPALMRKYGLRPKKSLGQNFLVDPEGLQKVMQAAEIDSGDTVLEIGAGLGSLTCQLAQSASRVVAVEIDAELFAPLKEAVAPYANVRLVQGDMLELDPAELVEQAGYRVVANIPYYITSALIRHLLEARVRPSRIVLTVQREVAERICAQPGDMSLLALSVQVYGSPRITDQIPADAFYPAPDVDSAVVRVDLYEQPVFPKDKIDLFFQLAKAGFSQKRKTLRNSLSAGMRWSPAQAEARLCAVEIDPGRRAQTLSLDEWGRLVNSVE